jgi:hypothetical protein
VHEAERLEQILDKYRGIFSELVGQYQDTSPALEALVQRIQTNHGALTDGHQVEQGGQQQPMDQGDDGVEETKVRRSKRPLTYVNAAKLEVF